MERIFLSFFLFFFFRGDGGDGGGGGGGGLWSCKRLCVIRADFCQGFHCNNYSLEKIMAERFDRTREVKQNLPPPPSPQSNPRAC